ncbi:MAG: hypothetical protein ACRYFX_17510 [Janthinobacterium lividum]
MLDFYLICDHEPRRSQPPVKSKYAGGIADGEFSDAQKYGIIEHRHDYYGDFRWSSQQAKVKLELLKNTSNMTLLFSLTGILQKAVEANSGLIAFGD